MSTIFACLGKLKDARQHVNPECFCHFITDLYGFSASLRQDVPGEHDVSNQVGGSPQKTFKHFFLFFKEKQKKRGTNAPL